MSGGERRPVAAEAAAVAGDEVEPPARSGGLDWELADWLAQDIDYRDDVDDEADSGLLAAAMGDPDAAADHQRDDTDQQDTVTADADTGGGGTVAMPTGTLPLAALDALPPEKRRRLARKRGCEWPDTDEARGRLADAIHEVMRHADDRVIDAPTSLGKTHTVAATRWGAREELTGGRPVVHLLETRDARDEAVEVADEHGGNYLMLQSRHEACPVAAGDHDPVEDDEADHNRQTLTVEGQSASEYIDAMCNDRGIPFSAVHRHLEAHNDQGVDLPCSADGECPAIRQWTRYREGDHPLVIATHNFAHAPGLRLENNLVIDEEPDYRQDLSTDRVRRAVGAYLREIDAPVRTWEAFVALSQHEGYAGDAAAERDAVAHALDAEPDRAWYFECDDAHILAPALARAVFHAESRANGRRHGKTAHEPPRLEAEARDDDGWNREYVSVVLDETNEIQTVRTVPDMNAARSVIGLDAHPALPKWQANTVPWIDTRAVLDRQERQLWRRYERGLRVVQVGDATRPLTSGEYFDHDGTRALLDQLHAEYGADVSTAITADAVEDEVGTLLSDVTGTDPETMHFGEEKSRNDFAAEDVGLVLGCIDPGDDHVLDLLAELDLDAEPERGDVCCQHCGDREDAPEEPGEGCPECNGTGMTREHGRGFVGADADTAAAILASVRENHIAQSAGRYARNPDDVDDTATVFVRTDAIPAGFADVQVPGVAWTYSEQQERVVAALRSARTAVTAREIAAETGVSKRHVHRTLKRLVENGVVDALPETGPNGATLYAEDGTPNSGVVDLTDEDGEVVTSPVWGSYTWAVTVATPDPADSDEDDHARQDTPGEWAWTATGGGDRPPDDPV